MGAYRGDQVELCLLFGNVKKVDNIDKMVHTFADHPLSLHENNKMVDIFTKAMQQILCLPGD